MAEQDLLASQLAELLRKQPRADIVVGLPSYNHGATIAGVVRAIRSALAQSFAELGALIVDIDAGSTDGTPNAVAELQVEPGAPLVQVRVVAQNWVMPYHGMPEKGEALNATLQIARQVGARACLVLTPDVTAPSPQTIEQLLAPIVRDGYDFALPLYLRHKFDGPITSSVVRPLLRALYGRRVQQPMSGDFAFSSALVERYLAMNVWGTELARFGSDIWTTTQAMCGGFKMCHVQVGPRNQARTAPSTDLRATVNQVLGSLFEDMTRNASVWQRVRGSLPIAVLGTQVDDALSPVSMDYRKSIESFCLGLKNLQDLWALVLAPATLLELRRAAGLLPERFALPDAVWCRVLFDFALGYRLRTINRSHLLEAFLPLYLGWLGGFVREMQDASDGAAEERVEELCRTYETEKPYLMSRWRSPDRFNP
jgi:glucosylglycerate synthase